MNMGTECRQGQKQSNFTEEAVLKADHVNNALIEYAFTGWKWMVLHEMVLQLI